MKERGESRIRTYEGISQQIYSLPQLTALVSPQCVIRLILPENKISLRRDSSNSKEPKKTGADGGIRTPDQLITNQLLWPTELHRRNQAYPSKIGSQMYNNFFIKQN